MVAERYEDLVCWQLATQLMDAVIVITESPQARKDQSFCDQVRRAARSVSSNIAEGFGRFAPIEFARFLTIARGSVLELDNLLQEATRRKLAPEDTIAHARDLLTRTLMTLTRLRSYLRTARAPKPRTKAREPRRTPEREER